MNRPEIWKDVRGYDGKYQVSYCGEVRRVFPSGKTRLMTPYKKTGTKHQKILRDRLFVKLTDDSGKPKEVAMLKIVSEAFLPPPKPGEVPYHINGVVTDNWVSNIGYISRSELGKKTGHISKAQAVIRIDKSGELVDTYRSAREAAKHCFMSYQTIIDRCNGFYKKGGKKHGFKSIFAPDGFAYSWDEDKYINKTLIQIQEEMKNTEVIVCLDGYDTQQEIDKHTVSDAEWYEIRQALEEGETT